jgi:5-epi-alpha-selinene synthase
MNVDLFCPFSTRVNPHVKTVQRQTLAWARSFSLLKEEAEYRHLGASRIGWLVARAHPDASQEGLQIGADWATLFCLLDDHTEDPRFNPTELGAYLSHLLHLFREGDLRAASDPPSHALLDLRERVLQRTDSSWVPRFALRLEGLFAAYSWEAVNRVHHVTPSFADYRAMRRMTSGLYPQLELVEVTDAIHLPPEARHDPALRQLLVAAGNCFGWANDLFTWEKETRHGEVHNLVTVLMHDQSLSLHNAVERAMEIHNNEMRRLIALAEQLPAMGMDGDVARFVQIIRSCLRSHIEWAKETARYTMGTQRDSEPIIL